MGRSIAAVVVGFVLIGALSVGADALLFQLVPEAFDADRRLTSTPLLLLTLLYVGAFATAGCYLCARLAPSRPMRHALILGALGLLMSAVVVSQTWNETPAWYNLVGLATTMVWGYLGGLMRERELARGGAMPAAATA